ncbi:MAG: hypothetical protein E7356_05380 [Clostridiales bacterium]|nr:hypothetical protein [Clostridiales bacterium]
MPKYDNKLDIIKPLIDYYDEYGTLDDIATCTEYNGIKIGMLVCNLRRRKDSLDDEAIDKLDDMGFVWAKKRRFVMHTKSFKKVRSSVYDKLSKTIAKGDYEKDKWLKKQLGNIYYAEFFAWYDKYGTLSNINFKSTIEVDGTLYNVGDLLHTVRASYKNKTMQNDDIEILELMGIVWNTRDLEHVFASIKEYARIYGSIADIQISDEIVYNGKVCAVGRQVNKLRVKYNRGELSQEYIDFCENLGMVWKVKSGAKEIKDLDVKYKYLKEYADIHGSLGKVMHLDDNLCMDNKCISIGHIINRLRQSYKKGELPPKDIEYLENLGMVWDRLEHDRKNIDCNKKYADLVAYAKKHGSLAGVKTVINSNEENIDDEESRIGRRISHIRAYYTLGTLTLKEVDFLEGLGMVWRKQWKSGRAVALIDKYKSLVEYADIFGSLADIMIIEKICCDNRVVSVGQQINHLRTRYGRGELPQEDIEYLENLGMVWKSPRSNRKSDKEMSE